MKRSTKLALSLVLAVGTIVPAVAQDNFPDVPANHWAYEALAKMKAEGLLVGYPDGLYRGPRPASRYELAVAMHAVYTNLKNLIDGMQTQLDALKTLNPQDIQNLKDAVAQLQNEVNAMKGWGDDIAALKKATEEFDRELHALGVDVEAMKRDLGSLAERVSVLEKRKPTVDISGDIDLLGITTNSSSNRFGLSEDGRLEGASGPATVGMFHDLTMMHEGAFTFAGTNETGPKWKATIVETDMFGNGAFGNQSSLPAPISQTYGLEATREDVYVQDLSVKFDAKLLGLGTDIEAGRVAYKSASPYVFMRPDNTSYFSNERWDDGMYRLDGAILGFNFGGLKFHIWGGSDSNMRTVDGEDLNPVIIANMRVAGGTSENIIGTPGVGTSIANDTIGIMDRSIGADATFGLGGHGHVDLNYLLLEQENKSPGPTGTDNLLNNGNGNRDSVFGGDASFKFGRFDVDGGYHVSDLTDNQTAVNDSDNIAWNAKIAYNANKFNIWGGYRQIDNNYYAPGDWGRLGIIQNPANIKGWQAGAYFDLTKALRFTATGEWDKGNKDEANTNPSDPLYESPFDTGTDITSYMARLDLRLNPNLSVFGSYQDTKFSSLDSSYFGTGGGPSGNPEYGWTTFGLGYGLSSNAKLDIQYQFSNVGNEFLLGGPSRYTGGILTSQLSIKF
jgi:hypothetical protein